MEDRQPLPPPVINQDEHSSGAEGAAARENRRRFPAFWPKEAELVLVNTWKEKQLEINGASLSLNDWKDVQTKLNAANAEYTYTVEQCRDKVTNLKRLIRPKTGDEMRQHSFKGSKDTQLYEALLTGCPLKNRRPPQRKFDGTPSGVLLLGSGAEGLPLEGPDAARAHTLRTLSGTHLIGDSGVAGASSLAGPAGEWGNAIPGPPHGAGSNGASHSRGADPQVLWPSGTMLPPLQPGTAEALDAAAVAAAAAGGAGATTPVAAAQLLAAAAGVLVKESGGEQKPSKELSAVVGVLERMHASQLQQQREDREWKKNMMEMQLKYQLEIARVISGRFERNRLRKRKRLGVGEGPIDMDFQDQDEEEQGHELEHEQSEDQVMGQVEGQGEGQGVGQRNEQGQREGQGEEQEQGQKVEPKQEPAPGAGPELTDEGRAEAQPQEQVEGPLQLPAEGQERVQVQGPAEGQAQIAPQGEEQVASLEQRQIPSEEQAQVQAHVQGLVPAQGQGHGLENGKHQDDTTGTSSQDWDSTE